MITVEKHKFIEYLSEILRMVVEEGETFEITDDGKVIAHVTPVSEAKPPDKRDVKTFRTNTDRLAAKIGAYSPERGDAVEIVRDMRRDFSVSEQKESREQNIKAFFADVDQLAAQIGAHWDGMSAVDAVRDVRRDL